LRIFKKFQNFQKISRVRIRFSGKVDAAILFLPALEDTAQRNLLPVVSIWIILPTAAKATVVEASTGAARVVANVTVLSKSAVGNAAATRTVTAR